MFTAHLTQRDQTVYSLGTGELKQKQTYLCLKPLRKMGDDSPPNTRAGVDNVRTMLGTASGQYPTGKVKRSRAKSRRVLYSIHGRLPLESQREIPEHQAVAVSPFRLRAYGVRSWLVKWNGMKRNGRDRRNIKACLDFGMVMGKTTQIMCDRIQPSSVKSKSWAYVRFRVVLYVLRDLIIVERSGCDKFGHGERRMKRCD